MPLSRTPTPARCQNKASTLQITRENKRSAYVRSTNGNPHQFGTSHFCRAVTNLCASPKRKRKKTSCPLDPALGLVNAIDRGQQTPSHHSDFVEDISGSLEMQRIPAQAQDFIPNQQATMDPNSKTAVTPFHLLGLPHELRNDIYEAAIFDLSPPELFMGHSNPNPFPLRNVNTNVLLTSRKVYWEALDVIMRRSQLIMVSATRLHPGLTISSELSVGVMAAWSGITMIHPKYRTLCIMNHRSMYQTFPSTVYWAPWWLLLYIWCKRLQKPWFAKQDVMHLLTHVFYS